MAFNGFQTLVKEEPCNLEINDQNNTNIEIKEEDYFPDNPDFVKLEDEFTAQEHKVEYSDLSSNPLIVNSTNDIKFNPQEWGNRCLNNNSNNTIFSSNPSTSGSINDSLHYDKDTSQDVASKKLQHFMLNDDSESSTRDSSHADFDQDWTEHKDGYFSCKICKIRCPDEFYLQNHFKSRRLGDKRFKCCSCDKIFRDNTQLSVHSRKHTGEKPYICAVCGKKFSVNGNLSKHMRIHTGERRFECFTCKKKFTQLAHLEDHIKTHSGERPYVCDFCNSSFKTKARLKKHKKSHEDEKQTKRSVPCPICMKIMKSTKQLLAHMETHDEGPHNPFPCNTCGKSYKNLFSLNIHLKSHGGLKEFQCTLCDKAFTNASHLRRHFNSHSGVRPFRCEICMRGFPSSQNLKRHLMTHTGEKPFSCDSCNKSFLTLENLNRHKRTHTGEKPFPCNICGKYFAHSTTAKEHMRIHTGDKPFVCKFCGKKFALNKTLYKHIREHHPDDFPEFKRQNDIPPNVKKAREKLKSEEFNKSTSVPTEMLNLCPDNNCLTIKTESETEINLKIEPIEEDVKYETFMDSLKLKPVDVKNSFEIDKIVIKKEKSELEGS